MSIGALCNEVELLETLGEGTFGVVYVARMREGTLSRTVVLKVLKRALAENDQALIRARDEAALLARLNHDHIVRVEQLTTLGNVPAVVMEHIQGATLDHVLRANGPLPTAVALDIAARVASALDAAFNRVPPGERSPLRVVHRDIKPSNIIVSQNGLVKVLDFGAARGDFEDRMACTQSIALGTPLYMAPEIFDGATPAPSVDVYALGATLFELLHGQPLGILSVRPAQHARKLASRLSELQPNDVSDDELQGIAELIAAGLAYEPHKRPSARQFQDRCRALRNALARQAPLDQWAESAVEPLYLSRPNGPPPADGSLLAPPKPARALAATLPDLQASDWQNLPTVIARTPIPPPTSTEMLEDIDLDDPHDEAVATPSPKPAAPASYLRWLAAVVLMGFATGLAILPPLRAHVRAAPARPAAVAEVPPQEPTRILPEPKVEPPALPPLEPVPTPERAQDSSKPLKKAPARPTERAPLAPTPESSVAPPPPSPTVSGWEVAIRLRSIPAGAKIELQGQPFRTPADLKAIATGAHEARVSFVANGVTTEGTCVLQVREPNQSFVFEAKNNTLYCPE